MKNSKITVIVRTINRPIMLEEALRSIDLQEHPSIEIIIINDGGPFLENIYNFPKNREAIYLNNKISRGRSYAANQGLRRATGEFISFLDDDDIFYPFHLSILLEFAESNNYDVVYSDALCAQQIICPFDERKYITTYAQQEKGSDFSREQLLADNFIPINTVLFKRSLVDQLSFDENLDVVEDWDFWLELSKLTEFHRLPEITCEYRKRLDNTNTSGQLDHIWWWSREYLKNKHEDLAYKASRE